MVCNYTTTDLLDHELVSVDGDVALHDHLLAHTLLLEGDEAEVLGRVVLHFVDRTDDLGDDAMLREVLADLKIKNTYINSESRDTVFFSVEILG